MTTEPDSLDLHGRSLRRWIGAATLITALHVCGGTWAMRNWHSEDILEEAAGAMVVEIAEVQTTATLTTLEHGTPDIDSKYIPPSTRQEQQVAAGEKQDEPLSNVPDPEVAVEKKPPSEQEDKPAEKVAMLETQAQNPSAKREARAPTEIEGVVAEKSVALRTGSSTTSNTAVRTWKSTLVTHINRHKRYPDAARSRGLVGEVQIVFAMDRSGHVLRSRIRHSSGSSVLDAEAIELFKRAQPLPLPPPAVQGEILEYVFPITFRM